MAVRGINRTQIRMLSYSPLAVSRRGGNHRRSELVGVAGFEPAASSSRSQRARSPTTALTRSDLPRTVRGRPLASAGVCGGCYSFSYSPARGTLTCARCPAVRSALDAGPEAYHNPAAVWWGLCSFRGHPRPVGHAVGAVSGWRRASTGRFHLCSLPWSRCQACCLRVGSQIPSPSGKAQVTAAVRLETCSRS